MTKRDLIICHDADELARKAAEQFIALAGAAIARSGRFTVALSADRRRGHLFWGDERCVPPDHAESNYRMVQEALLSRISIPPEDISPDGGRKGAARSRERVRRGIAQVLCFGAGPRATV